MNQSQIIQQYVPVIYAGSLKPISLAIMAADRVRYSHVAFDCGDHVIEARGGHGVVNTPIEEFLLRYGWVKHGLYPTAVHPDDCLARAQSDWIRLRRRTDYPDGYWP